MPPTLRPQDSPSSEPRWAPPPSPRLETITLASGAEARAVRVGNDRVPTRLTEDSLREALDQFAEALAGPGGCAAIEFQMVVVQCSLAPLAQLGCHCAALKRLAFLDNSRSDGKSFLDDALASILKSARGGMFLEELDLSYSGPTDARESVINLTQLLHRLPYLRVLRLEGCVGLGRLAGHNLAERVSQSARQDRPLRVHLERCAEARAYYMARFRDDWRPVHDWIVAEGNVQRHWKAKGAAGADSAAGPDAFRIDLRTCVGYLRERPGDPDLRMPPGTVHRVCAFRLHGGSEKPLQVVSYRTVFAGERSSVPYDMIQWAFTAETAAAIGSLPAEDREAIAELERNPVRMERAELERLLGSFLPAVFGDHICALERGRVPQQDCTLESRKKRPSLPAFGGPKDPHWVLYVIRRRDLPARAGGLAAVLQALPAEGQSQGQSQPRGSQPASLKRPLGFTETLRRKKGKFVPLDRSGPAPRSGPRQGGPPRSIAVFGELAEVVCSKPSDELSD